MTRKIVQIAGSRDTDDDPCLFALLEDGSLWKLTGPHPVGTEYRWNQLPLPSQASGAAQAATPPPAPDGRVPSPSPGPLEVRGSILDGEPLP